MHSHFRNLVPGVLILLMVVVLPGCIIVRTTELRVKLNDDGTGEALMRLLDIRSDSQNDSAVVRDFGVMMASMEKEGIEDFERQSRKITSKRLFVEHDTLSAEIAFTFTSWNAIDGLHVTDDAMFIVINQGREIVKTNGSVEPWGRTSKRIVWKKDARRLLYVVREMSIPTSTSLAPLYEKYRQ